VTRTRRGHGEGTIYKRPEPDGRWVAQYRTEPGKRKSLYREKRQEVQRKRTKALRELELGLPAVEEKQTVAQYLASWLETVKPPTDAEDTWSRYEDCVRPHIVPEVGKVKLAQLTPQQVQRNYATCSASGLSSITARHVHAVLHRALNAAVRLGLVVRNVSDMVEKPKKRHVPIHPMTREQSQAYLAAAEGDRLEALFVLALATGMRLGELLALKWSEVDIERRVVHVVSTLKWRPGEATVGAPGEFPWRAPLDNNPSRSIRADRFALWRTSQRISHVTGRSRRLSDLPQGRAGPIMVSSSVRR
jgi:integrase